MSDARARQRPGNVLVSARAIAKAFHEAMMRDCTHCPIHCPEIILPKIVPQRQIISPYPHEEPQQQQQGGKRKSKTLKSRKSGRQTRSRR